MWVQVPTEAEVLDPLELEFLVVVSHLIWMLGTNLGSSGRSVSTALNL